MPSPSPAIPDQTLDNVSEYHFALSEEKHDRLQRYLFPSEFETTPDGASNLKGLGERGLIGIITRSTGSNRITHLLHSLVKPEPGDVNMEESANGWGKRLHFSANYRARATERVDNIPGGGLVYFHTHPGWGAYPSNPDLDSAQTRFTDLARNVGHDAPMAAVIVAEKPRRESATREWSVRGYGSASTNDDPSPSDIGLQAQAGAVRVVGEQLRKLATTKRASGPAGAGGSPTQKTQDSTLELWGERGQQRLAGIRVGVIGCGGVGSLLAEQIARLGVADAVFIDFDSVKPVNLNRAYGTTREDARQERPKAEVARRVAGRSASSTSFSAEAVIGSIVEEKTTDYAALGAALDCDILLNAADPHWVRKVLDEIAYAHLIPVLDGGTNLVVDEVKDELAYKSSSEIAAAGPGHPCLECTGAWFEGDLAAGVVRDRKPPNERDGPGGLYAEAENGDGAEAPRDPSIVTTNGLVASTLMERLHAMLVGTTTETLVGKQVYRPSAGTMNWQKDQSENRLTSCRDDCTRAETEAEGDYAEVSTGHDYDMRKELEEFSDIYDTDPSP